MTKTPSSHYPPFGSTLPTHSWSDASRAYRYGFNGKEKDSETANDNFPITIGIGARIHDARLGRFLSVDPLSKEYPWNSSYAFAENIVISCIDLEGKESAIAIVPRSPNSSQLQFINIVALKVMEMAKSNGYSQMGQILIVGLMINEQGYSQFGNFNQFGLGGATNNIPFKSLQESWNYFDGYIRGNHMAFVELMKKNKVSSDEINKSLNSGPYIREYNHFKNALKSYNYDADDSEPFKVIRSTSNGETTTGMRDYGHYMIESAKNFIGRMVGYFDDQINSINLQVSDLNTQKIGLENKLNSHISRYSERLRISSLLDEVNASLSVLNETVNQIEKEKAKWLSVASFTDSGTNTSSNNSNQTENNNNNAQYKQNIISISTTPTP